MIIVKKWMFIPAALLFAAALLLSQTPESTPFLEKPYLQLGNAPNLSASESLVLMWHTTNAPADWKVEVANFEGLGLAGRRRAKVTGRFRRRPVSLLSRARTVQRKMRPPHPPSRHTWYIAPGLTGLRPGEEFRYRVLESGKAGV